jgi:predicted N-acetyltransferase YhbS
MREALWRAAMLDHKAVLLVGDAPYCARFGFDAANVEPVSAGPGRSRGS